MEELLKLQLHEEMLIDWKFNSSAVVIRVPWWWIYTRHTVNWLSSVFVPFNNEFQKSDNIKLD